MELSVGKKAPDFTLEDQTGTAHTLSDYKGKWVLIYFYPKDDTPGCTKEACGIRDHYSEYEKNGIQVFGISADTVRKHEKFVDKYQLPFTLLADVDKEVCKAYDAWGPKKFMGREFLGIKRVSFLIDDQGLIAKLYPKVKPAEHAEEVLADYQTLSSEATIS